jgi:RNA polymerase sigma factor (sigma-70 family)
VETPAAPVDPTPIPDVDWDYLRRAAYATCRHIPQWIQRDDLVQEANLAAWQAASRWDEAGGASFTRFVTQRGVGAVRDVLRANTGSTRHGRSRLVVVPLESGAEPSATDRDTLLDVDLRETLDRAVNRLPPKQRHVVIERFFHNRTLGDVGREMGVTEAAVSRTSTRALQRLQHDALLRDWIK